MEDRNKTITVELTLPNETQQEALQNSIRSLRRDFPGADIQTKVSSRKLTATDVVISLILSFGSRVIYDLARRAFDELAKHSIRVRLSYHDRVELAKSLLQKNGISKFTLEEQTDLSGESRYRFADSKKRQYRVTVYSDGRCDYSTGGL